MCSGRRAGRWCWCDWKFWSQILHFFPLQQSSQTPRKLAWGINNSGGIFKLFLLLGRPPPSLPNLPGDHHFLEELCFFWELFPSSRPGPPLPLLCYLLSSPVVSRSVSIPCSLPGEFLCDMDLLPCRMLWIHSIMHHPDLSLVFYSGSFGHFSEFHIINWTSAKGGCHSPSACLFPKPWLPSWIQSNQSCQILLEIYLYKNLFVVYLIFKLNWAPCFGFC